ncbi:MAG: hypothetical protein GX638_09285 [Crenarchaeota archaeon]|nr:hypothetical protein [Thermoproteota archaeon]
MAGKLSKVIVAESRPLLEGLNFANRLLDFGIPVTIVVDAGLGFFSKNATFALVGADTVQSDGSLVHKIGTYPLALACYDLGKSFYVVCDTLKFSKTATINQPVKIEQKSPTEIVNKNKLCNAEIKNIYFDNTPAKLVTEIITEEKKFKPNRKKLDKKNKSGCY